MAVNASTTSVYQQVARAFFLCSEHIFYRSLFLFTLQILAKLENLDWRLEKENSDEIQEKFNIQVVGVKQF